MEFLFRCLWTDTNILQKVLIVWCKILLNGNLGNKKKKEVRKNTNAKNISPKSYYHFYYSSVRPSTERAFLITAVDKQKGRQCGEELPGPRCPFGGSTTQGSFCKVTLVGESKRPELCSQEKQKRIPASFMELFWNDVGLWTSMSSFI